MKSITRHLVIFFSAISASVLIGLGIFVTHSIEQHFKQNDRQELLGKLTLIRHAFKNVQSPLQFDSAIQQLQSSLIGHKNLLVAIYAPDGKVLYPQDSALPLPPVGRFDLQTSAHEMVFTLTTSDAEYRVLTASIAIPYTSPVVIKAVLAVNIAHHSLFMREINRSLWIVILLSIIFVGIMGFAVTRQGLKPLRKMTAAAHAISAEQLHSRLELSTIPSELLPLGRAYNEMLARLEDSFRRLTDFSADLAHEMRTPLSNLVLQTQVVLSQARPSGEYRETLFSNLEEYERLSRMIADMLFLAKADNEMVTPQRESIELAREIETLFNYFNILAEERGIVLTRFGAAQISADRTMLQRALYNLIINAINHTDRGGTVNITLKNASDGSAIIEVENPGKEISPEHLDRLFDRFYRADSARQRHTEGAGLGLAITKSIVQAHGGTVTVHSTKSHTQFILQIPHYKNLED